LIAIGVMRGVGAVRRARRALSVDTNRGVDGSLRAVHLGPVGLVFDAPPDAEVAVARSGGRNGVTGQVPGRRPRPAKSILRAVRRSVLASRLVGVDQSSVASRSARRVADAEVDGWPSERVLELLWGPRKPSHSRARKLPRVRALIELRVVATWVRNAPVAQRASPGKRTDDADTERVARRLPWSGRRGGADSQRKESL
jgi:hypothetical protein